MNIDSIKNGIVLDHLTPGKGMEVYRLLGLDHLDCHIAIIKNAPSRKMGKKDIIKIAEDIALDTEVLGYICPGATVNIIKDGKLVEKKKMSLPERLTNVVECHNPRCITTTEQELPQIFVLTDAERAEYRCIYCETLAKR
jgi:aspartate carbamoyltransferase regulatory subunit